MVDIYVVEVVGHEENSPINTFNNWKDAYNLARDYTRYFKVQTQIRPIKPATKSLNSLTESTHI